MSWTIFLQVCPCVPNSITKVKVAILCNTSPSTIVYENYVKVVFIAVGVAPESVILIV